MKVFISSLIRGMEDYRDAAASAIAMLAHQPTRAEDFGASVASPQVACLAGVREADVMVLILSGAYGQVQASGMSATHEEYREARDEKPVLVFVHGSQARDPQQSEFVREVQGWEHGHFTADFGDANDLREKVVRALHEAELADATAPLDHSELLARAERLVAATPSIAEPALVFALAGGPSRPILRPSELESVELRDFLLAEALTGPASVLTPSVGTESTIRADTLELNQREDVGRVSLDEQGNIVVAQPAVQRGERRTGIPSIVEEEIGERLVRALRLSARVLDQIDPIQRMSHVAPVAALHNAGHRPWRTREEHDRSPNSATMGFRSADSAIVVLSPAVRRRAALTHDTHRLAEDLLVRLRREVKG